MKRCATLILLCPVLMLNCRAGNDGADSSSGGPARARDSAVQAPPPGPIDTEEQKFPDGTVKSRTEGYRDAEGRLVPHGVTTVWHQNGNKKLEQSFAHGKSHGPRKLWYLDGRIRNEENYVEGLEDGTWRTYYLDGTLQLEWSMQRGTRHGLYIEYHPNGKKRVELEFVDGKRQGPHITYDDQGVAVFQTDFVDGIEQP